MNNLQVMHRLCILAGLFMVAGCSVAPAPTTEQETTQTTSEHKQSDSDHQVVRECASGTTIYKLNKDGRLAVWSAASDDSHWDYLADGVTPDMFCSLSKGQ